MRRTPFEYAKNVVFVLVVLLAGAAVAQTLYGQGHCRGRGDRQGSWA